MAVVVAGGLFSWDRWFRYDDAADIQGSWKNPATNETVVFDGSQMRVAGAVAYGYSLDAQGKTITYSFQSLTGTAHYYFDRDRSTLVLSEGSPAPLLVQLGLEDDPAIAADAVSDGTTVLERVAGA